MATRTVRLDAEEEEALREVCRTSGLTASGVLKRGLLLMRDRERETLAIHPFEVYERLELGEGGSAHAAGRDAKRAIRAKLARR